MRKIVLSGVSALALAVATGGVAVAADPAGPYEPPATVAPAGGYDWSGAYIGGHIGYGNGDYWFDSTNDERNSGSIVGGVQAGYNWQVMRPGAWDIVWGIEADVSITDMWGGDTGYAYAEVDLLASLRARLGFAFDNILIYGTAGLGFVDGQAASSTDVFSSFSEFTGVVGAGVEYGYSENVTMRFEALDYLETGVFPAGDDLGRVENIWVARFGVNYRF